MYYPEFKRNLEDGTLNPALDYWVCDFRHADINNKPIRHIKPTRCQVFPAENSRDHKGKTVYYADHYFRPYGKTSLLATTIAPYDNTGYRAYPGASLSIFATEQECNGFYREQCKKVEHQAETAMHEFMEKMTAAILNARQLISETTDH